MDFLWRESGCCAGRRFLKGFMLRAQATAYGRASRGDATLRIAKQNKADPEEVKRLIDAI